jgi:hypothetical protein
MAHHNPLYLVGARCTHGSADAMWCAWKLALLLEGIGFERRVRMNEKEKKALTPGI